MKIEEIVKLLALNGLTTSMSYDENLDMLYIDLNTQAKSHLYLYEDEIIRGRYGYEKKVDFSDSGNLLKLLCEEFARALHFRDYGNIDWFELCNKMNIKIND